ncbi:hypothetical protein L596_030730 [Steinernema carpocapsae]|nr:hypothetical protein L596_030730 [Steinernema carpocapsae]
MYPFQQLYNQDNATKTRETFKSICRETYEDIASYWDQFMKTYKNESQFVFLWNVNLAHNRIDGLYHADEPYYRLLESHEKRLENAFVFILGDHGLRHGKVRKTKKGELEDFNPFLMVSVPDQYRDSPIMNVLRKNSRNLISHYDTYASLIHLSKMIKGDTLKEEFENPSQEPFKAGHGSSYFRVNMNQPRHCSDLRIPYEYCLCDKSLEKPIAANSTTAKLLADSIVASMQAKIDELKMTHLCSPRTVKYASTVAAKLVSEDKRKIYKVQITTNPGGGVFSGFVEIRDGTALPISNRFSRENTYGKQGDCVVNIEELPYCYCKNS